MTGGLHASPPAELQYRSFDGQAEPARRADEQHGQYVVDRPELAPASATSPRGDVLVRRARIARHPDRRLLGRIQAERVMAPRRLKRRCRGHAHDIAGAVEPKRVTEPTPWMPMSLR